MGSKTIVAPTQHAQGRAERFTGLELLFDLIFVFCVAQLTRVYRDDPSWAIAGRRSWCSSRCGGRGAGSVSPPTGFPPPTPSPGCW